ncbi:MAG: cupin domain-containing protein [Thermoanaerobaculia bacterium]|nr:cupin domain-containing protein [Thermoanaerobaculia bacterium]
MSTPPIAHFPAEQVRAAFATGKVLLANPAYQVHASLREQPGEAELHALDTDVFFALEGEATVVLGGTILEPRQLSPTETRGTAIEGGEDHRLAPGDVLVIPAGTPHWFRDVRGPMRYYTVKVPERPE